MTSNRDAAVDEARPSRESTLFDNGINASESQTSSRQKHGSRSPLDIENGHGHRSPDNLGKDGAHEHDQEKRDADTDQDAVRVENGVPLVRLSPGGNDKTSPLNMPPFRKWLAVFLVSTGAFCVTCCSSMVALSYPGTRQEFGLSEEVVTLGLSLYIFGLGFFPHTTTSSSPSLRMPPPSSLGAFSLGRWDFLRWAFVEALIIYLLVPETFLPARLKQKAKRLRKAGRNDVKAPIEVDERSIPKVVAMSCVRPFQILATEPMALALCTWTALLLGLIYAFFSAFSLVYTEYGFTPQFVGLSFTGLGVGVTLGTLAVPFWDRAYRQAESRLGHRPPPEEHLRKAMAAAVIIPASLFWFAWTTLPSVHWIVSEIASAFFGLGSLWAFQATFSYLVDAYRPVAASAMSANSAMRSTFGGVFPLFTTQMFRGLGNQWALTLCAFLCLALSPFPFLVFCVIFVAR
ncbi:hypothetical protein OIV83_000521 [Microbotryomycetes sp. JL201]|nr:hypothetical protein OIV83_000521 [Microbotryomycetes sp. JL201]